MKFKWKQDLIGLGLPLLRVSAHRSVRRERGIVESVRRGTKIISRLKDHPAAEMLEAGRRKGAVGKVVSIGEAKARATASSNLGAKDTRTMHQTPDWFSRRHSLPDEICYNKMVIIRQARYRQAFCRINDEHGMRDYV